MTEFAERVGANVQNTDEPVKNKFKFTGLEEKIDNGDFLSSYLRKLNHPGKYGMTGEKQYN